MAGWAGGFAGAFIGKSGRSGSGVWPVSLRQPSGRTAAHNRPLPSRFGQAGAGGENAIEVSFPLNRLDSLKFAIRLILRHAFHGCYSAT